MINLTYDRVEKALVDAVPEVRDKYKEFFRWWKSGPPDLYNIFLFTLEPVLMPALGSGSDADLLDRIFRYFEDMARSGDIQVRNLLQVEILEKLVGDRSKLSVAWQYMGEETKKLARETARIRSCEENLPPKE
jgi:hypothetical protein